MKRRHISFDLDGAVLSGTIDSPDNQSPDNQSPDNQSTGQTAKTGLLIISGGNEIRSGAHAGQARLAHKLCDKGYIVMRFDRRGIGDSSGENRGFLSSRHDIMAALDCFRAQCPELQNIIAFGNCDAASALMLFQSQIGFEGLILANPWTVDEEAAGEQMDTEPELPSAAAIRQRYWQKIKDPGAVLRLFTGKVDLKKLATGLNRARANDDQPTQLAGHIADECAVINAPTAIILAEQDRTAMDFAAAWNHDIFETARNNPHITVQKCKSASHSFADPASFEMLKQHILQHLADYTA